MSVVRHYSMIAAEDRIEQLREALTTLAARVVLIDCCEGVELLQDSQAPAYFIFAERWTSAEAHKAGGPSLGKTALTDVLAALAEPPQGRYLDYLPLTAPTGKAVL